MSKPNTAFEAQLEIGPSAIDAYSRLSYTMWYALAEFLDNSTQSLLNYGGIIRDVLRSEGQPLIVRINHDRANRELRVRDNSIGMGRETLRHALCIAKPTKDSKGRSKYGMGMKTAACWIGRKWTVVTCEWGSGEELTAVVDVGSVARGEPIPVTARSVSTDEHYTEILITDMRRRIQKRTEETIRSYLGSMYRFDLIAGGLEILLNDQPVNPPKAATFDTDPEGNVMRRELPPTTINGRKVKGWVGVLAKGAGGRKHGGFSLFRHKRQIQGFPKAWKPRAIFGGVDDEGANNLVAQRLTGLLELDDFEVSHTKDAILFQENEEDELEKWLAVQVQDYVDYATRRRSQPPSTRWAPARLQSFLEATGKELSSPEMRDKLSTALLPPPDVTVKKNSDAAQELAESEKLTTLPVLPDLRIVVSFQERSENDPYVRISAGAEAGVIHIILNATHTYYGELEADDIREEVVRQFIYDALAEYRVSKLMSSLNPNSVRRMKDELLRVSSEIVENAAATARRQELEAINDEKPGQAGGASA